MKEQECNNLLAVLQQKKDGLEKMLTITRELRRLIEADRIDEFAAGLKKREQIIAKIDAFAKIEREFADQGDAQTDKLKAQTQTVIREILNLDSENARLAADKISHYKKQIKSINENKKGMDNYTKTSPSDDAFFVDTKE